MTVKSQEEVLAKDKVWEFNSLGTFYIAGRGKCFNVKLPITCIDFDWIINKKAKIDEEIHTIIGVEKRAHSPPWRTGEEVSLLVSQFGKL
jgi:hypothetical protein